MKIVKSISVLLLTLILVSCEKELTLLPEDTMSPDVYFSNQQELELWTNRFYTQFDGATGAAGQNADDHVDNNLGSLILGQRDPASENGWSFGTLRNINYYIQNSGNTLEESVRSNYDGVAYFMRAYFYFNKVRRYGDVPIYDQVLTTADDELLFQARDDRSEVMDMVIADLDKAIELLSDEKSISRVTKWTALAFKTRAALYEGTYRKYHGLSDADKYLQHAVSAGQEFINSSGYSLYAQGDEPYRSLFNSVNAQAEEVILARLHTSGANLMHGIQFNIINDKHGFTKRFMNHYLMADGTRYTDQSGWDTNGFIEEVANRDPRLAQTVLTPGYVQTGTSTTTRNSLTAVTGYQPIKFVGDPMYDGSDKSISDFPLFRSAEVYLNFAEAKAELGSITQQDLDISINKIRERANMPALSLTAANGNPDALLLDFYPNITRGDFTGVLLEIRRERTVELVMEGFRQWDLLRWKEGAQLEQPFYGVYFPGPGSYDMDADGTDDLVLWEGTPERIDGGTSLEIGADVVLSEGSSGYIVAYPTIPISWNETRDYLWPIPTDQRVLTQGKLSQNPGWEDSSGF